MARPKIECRRVRALAAVTEAVPNYGMVSMDPDSGREAMRFPLVPVSVIERLVRERRIADDAEGYKEGVGGVTTEVVAPVTDMTALRAKYEALLGKKPFAGWSASELHRRMDEAATAAETELDAPAA